MVRRLMQAATVSATNEIASNPADRMIPARQCETAGCSYFTLVMPSAPPLLGCTCGVNPERNSGSPHQKDGEKDGDDDKRTAPPIPLPLDARTEWYDDERTCLLSCPNLDVRTKEYHTQSTPERHRITPPTMVQIRTPNAQKTADLQTIAGKSKIMDHDLGYLGIGEITCRISLCEGDVMTTGSPRV